MIKVMADLLKAGKIRSVGVSNFSAEQMKIAHTVLQEFGIPLVSNQVKYSLLDRHIEKNGVLDTAQELGITIIAYSPLAQGLLSGNYHFDPQLLVKIEGFRRWLPAFSKKGLSKSRKLVDTLRQVADKYQKTISQIVLNWTIHFHGESIVAIPGASNAVQAYDNATAQQFIMESQDLELIHNVSQPGT
jgi:aryl-alcohol dehydrogenase-like predicted oxidoreductase